MKRVLITGIAIAGIAASAVFAGGHSASPEEKAVKARISHMELYAFNLGILGAMAKGDMDYNGDLAAAIAGDLDKLANVSQFAYWPEGTSTDDMEGTRALPVGWENFEQSMALAGDLGKATAAMVEGAGSLEGLQAAMGAVGKACGACHKATRAPKK